MHAKPGGLPVTQRPRLVHDLGWRQSTRSSLVESENSQRQDRREHEPPGGRFRYSGGLDQRHGEIAVVTPARRSVGRTEHEPAYQAETPEWVGNQELACGSVQPGEFTEE